MSRVTAKTWLNRISGFAAALYPIVAHLSIYFHKREYAVVYLIVLFTLFLLQFTLRIHWLISLVMGLLLYASIYFMVQSNDIHFWLYLPPVLIPLWLSVIFLDSLRTPDGAIVSRVASLMEGGALDEKQSSYTRYVTIIWGVVLLLMAVEAIILAWFAPFIVWSWWAHIGNYLVLLILFVSEMLVRWIWLRRGPKIGHMFRVMLKRPWNVRGE